MNIIHMNEGRKIATSLDGLILTLGGTLAIDIGGEQRDIERVINVFVDADGTPSFEGDTFAAVIVIPPRRYGNMEVKETVGGEEVTQIVSVPQPCQISAVTLHLWAVPEPTNHTETEE